MESNLEKDVMLGYGLEDQKKIMENSTLSGCNCCIALSNQEIQTSP